MLKREELKREDTWALTDLFESDKKWEEAFSKASSQKRNFAKYKGKLGDKKTLLECLKSLSAARNELEVIMFYPHLKKEENTADTKYQGYTSQIENLFMEFGLEVNFIDPELAALPEAYLKECIADKDFKDFDYMLKDTLRQRKHILSEKEEKLITLGATAMGTFYDAYQRLDNADLKFGSVKDGEDKDFVLTHGTWALARVSQDRVLRERAFKHYHLKYKEFLNTFATVFAGNVQTHLFYARARGFNSCIEKSVFDEDVNPKVYDNLLKAVGDNVKCLHDYMTYRKRELGYKEMHMYDLYQPIMKNVEIAVEYAEAAKIVKSALAPLGTEYQGLLEEAFTKRWIDVYETEGKRSGAFCSHIHSAPHPYVLLNYQKTLNEIFTIAHELGHAMHSWYSNKYQPFEKSQYRIFVAEVASTVNEIFLLKHLLKTEKDKNVLKYLMNYYLEMFRTTVFRQTMFAEFEFTAHDMAEKNQPLTHAALSDKYLELNKKYYGKDVVADEEIKYEWARVPHFYYNFYVYKYATGLISAVSIAEGILSDKTGKNLKAYTDFLKSGGSDSPVELLKIAGIDLTTAKPFNDAFKSFSATLAELNKL